LVLTLVMLAGCVAGPNEIVNTPNGAGRIAGFWQGLWHKIIVPITFVVALLSDKFHVFEVHNNGNWYVLGFLLGLTTVWRGGGRTSARWR